MNDLDFFKSVNEINEACFIEFQEKYIRKQKDQIEVIKIELEWMSFIPNTEIPFEHKKSAMRYSFKHLKSLIK